MEMPVAKHFPLDTTDSPKSHPERKGEKVISFPRLKPKGYLLA